MKSLLWSSIVLLSILFISCGPKETPPVQVGALNEYRDPAFGFRIKYPQDWKQLGTSGEAVFTRSQEVANKFLDPTTGEAGAQVRAEVIRDTTQRTLEAALQAGKDLLRQTWANLEIQPDQQVNVAGKTGTKVPYTVPVTSKTSIKAYEVYVQGDTAVYRLTFMGYGDQFEAHQAVFDTMLHSFTLPVVVMKGPDVWSPSDEMATYNSPYFSFQYPENMESMPANKGNNDFSVAFRADRLDCSIRIDVFGAKGLTVEKVWDQNKGRYRAQGTGETTIDGVKAIWVNYSPMANITSRAYFMVKNDKVIRPTISWFTPQRDVYFPPLEGIVKSMKLK